MNIKKFLRRGETTVYTTHPSLMRRVTAALTVSLAVAALTAPTAYAATEYRAIPKGGYELSISAPSIAMGKVHISNSGATASYEADAHTLMYQGLVDPTMTKVRAVSVESAYLDQFIENLPDTVSHLEPGVGFDNVPIGQYPADKFQTNFIFQAPSGMAISFHDSTDDSSYCFVRSMGISTSFEQTKPGDSLVTRSDLLYAVTPSHQEAYTLIHELAHCAKIQTDLDVGSDRLSNMFRVAFSEVRSDLAVVLYTASKTGSFTEGMAAVGALRGNLSLHPDHSTVGMLEVLLNDLDPSAYEGKPVHELIQDATSVIDNLSPDQVDDLKLAFAKDAFAQRTLIGQGAGGERIRDANSAFARFAGTEFSVNLDEFGQRNVQYSLDNAMLNADAIRAAGELSAQDAHNYASSFGVSLTADQQTTADYLSNQSDALNAGTSPLDLNIIEQQAKTALANSTAIITAAGSQGEAKTTHFAAFAATQEQRTSKQRFDMFDTLMQVAVEKRSQQQIEQPHEKPSQGMRP